MRDIFQSLDRRCGLQRCVTLPHPHFPKKKKAAEQDVARLALEGILHRTRDEGLSLVDQISPIFKSIMNEYAHKLHVEQPTYNTDKQLLGGVLPAFITSLVFNGTSYTGGPAGTKKDVEQSAAKAAILSIMGILPWVLEQLDVGSLED
ncbi:Double-stranded RNA-binding protein 4 [Glycine soja]|uniref:Double-stranded RNA-binding protein 4 n=1 Tax=Glycine soja TaxID=3848 RepID=A0A0B2QFW6_GLYSO|nr:Double-stranded RNA-binding protein 4 [Glycine soja]